MNGKSARLLRKCLKLKEKELSTLGLKKIDIISNLGNSLKRHFSRLNAQEKTDFKLLVKKYLDPTR